MPKFDFTQDDFGEELAERFREEHRVTSPVLDLTSIAEQAFDADVAFMEMPGFLEGITAKDHDTGTTLIAIATSGNPERQRFSLAHEIGHLAAGHLRPATEDDLDAPSNDIELQAHAFARHLLLPRSELSSFLAERGHLPMTQRTLSDIVEHFRVSGTVAAIQLQRIGAVDDERAREWREVEASALAVRYGWAEEWSNRVVDSRSPKPPKRMAANATDAYLQHLLAAEGVAAVEGMPVERLLAQFDEAGVRPAAPLPAVSLDEL